MKLKNIKRFIFNYSTNRLRHILFDQVYDHSQCLLLLQIVECYCVFNNGLNHDTFKFGGYMYMLRRQCMVIIIAFVEQR